MVFQFEHLKLWNDKVDAKLDIVEFKQVLSKWQNALYNNGWNALFIENHDIPRAVSTLGNDKEYLYESATCLGLMYFMQQGTPFIYQGQEIGMTNVKFSNIEDYDDVMTKNNYYIGLEKGESNEELMKRVWQLSRDNARTPMQWDSSENGGFTKGKPWIGVNKNYKNINVDLQLKDENSVLNFYKKMIKVMKENQALVYGKYNMILENHEKIYAYERILNDEKFLVITNLSNDEVGYSYEFNELKFENLIISNYSVKKHDVKTTIRLKPWEARMYKL